jgi:hypothetical protein
MADRRSRRCLAPRRRLRLGSLFPRRYTETLRTGRMPRPAKILKRAFGRKYTQMNANGSVVSRYPTPRPAGERVNDANAVMICVNLSAFAA